MSGQDKSHEVRHIAIVGSGPSAFYAAEALLRSDQNVQIDMIERLPTPYGLVRSGVAPDHPKLKQSILVYDKIARHENFNFLGNVTVGRDVSIAQLQDSHHAIILACGASDDRPLSIPGIDLAGSHTATEFVGWYNGHPDYRDSKFDLNHEVAVIVGQGNVAADVCRILAKTVDELRETDIAEHALDTLAESKVREIHIVGRRGPAQAKFTAKELRELGTIPNVVATAKPDECVLNDQSEAELAERSNINAVKNMEIFRKFSLPQDVHGARTINFHFCLSPVALLGESRIEAISLARNRLEGSAFSQTAHATDERHSISCGLVFRSIGYRGVPIAGMPFDNAKGVVPNVEGRVVDGNTPIPGAYVTGWFKRGPSGIIGTNRADSLETVEKLLTDLPTLGSVSKTGRDALMPVLEKRGLTPVTFSDWLKIDDAEIERGKKAGKPREKFTRVDEMVGMLQEKQT